MSPTFSSVEGSESLMVSLPPTVNTVRMEQLQEKNSKDNNSLGESSKHLRPSRLLLLLLTTLLLLLCYSVCAFNEHKIFIFVHTFLSMTLLQHIQCVHCSILTSTPTLTPTSTLIPTPTLTPTITLMTTATLASTSVLQPCPPLLLGSLGSSKNCWQF